MSYLQCGLGKVTVCGRTDRNVSAISQIINFSPSNKDLNPNQVLQAIRLSNASKEGRLVAYECNRVPKKFNSRSSAIWRKYTYFFPLNICPSGSLDVDINHLNTILEK